MNVLRKTLCLAILLVGIVAPARLPAQNVESTDIEAVDLPLEFESLWEEVSQKCASLEQIESIPLFTDFITRLEATRLEQELGPETESWLLGALFCRAEAGFNLRNMEDVDADLRRILELDPGFEIDSSKSSARLAALLDEIRGQTVGELLLQIEAEGVGVTIDGDDVQLSSEPLLLLAGPHVVEAARPGFSSFSQEVEVAPGETLTLEIPIERISAVVEVTIEPCGARFELDGQPVGEAAPPTDKFWEPGLPCSLVIPGLEIGERVLRISKNGFRAWEGKLDVTDLIDYLLPPITLDATSGFLTVAGLPSGIQFTVDGRLEQSPASDGGPVAARFELPTGLHEVRVDLGTVGFFEEQIELEDKEEETVAVDLKPTLSYLGAIGGDAQSQSQLDRWLETALTGIERPLFRRAGCDTAELFADHGIEGSLLRELATQRPLRAKPWNERRLQEELDARCRGSMYLLGVLPDDPLAVTADLWIWSAAPGAFNPIVRTIELPPGGAMQAVLDGLGAELSLTRTWIGVELIDSLLKDGPIVVSVAQSGPAAEAGLQPGDEVLMADGETVGSNRQFLDRLAASKADATLTLGVTRGAESFEVAVTVGTTPVVVPLVDAATLPPAASAQISLLRRTGSALVEAWVLDLNQAAVLVAAGEWGLAARELDRIRAPERPGLSRATVDYLLARALLNGGNEAHRERAQQALARAAQDEQARLTAHDGQRIAPRARIRLGQLTAAASSGTQ